MKAYLVYCFMVIVTMYAMSAGGSVLISWSSLFDGAGAGGSSGSGGYYRGSGYGSGGYGGGGGGHK